jgi:hypothetical protein
MDPLDTHGDALRQALHAEADAVVPAPDGLDRIRVRVTRRRWYRHGTANVAGLLLLNALILLFALGGS